LDNTLSPQAVIYDFTRLLEDEMTSRARVVIGVYDGAWS
jgi:hypothetical protein